MLLTMKKLLLLLALAAPLSLFAQEPEHGGIPDDVYYLMPSFGQGYIYFRGQMPAQGKLNICALDNTLRYLDKDGQEVVAAQADNIFKVLIDTVQFLRSEDTFFRLHPLLPDMGIAVERRVRIKRDVKEVGYGGTSQTSSTQTFSTMYADGAVYDMQQGKEYPYEVEENLYLYKGDAVTLLSKRSLRKLFPEKKADIDAWFKAGNPLPKTVEGALELLKMWL